MMNGRTFQLHYSTEDCGHATDLYKKGKDSDRQAGTLRTILRMVGLYIAFMWKRSKGYTVFLVFMTMLPGLMRAMSMPALEGFVSGVEQAAAGAGIQALLTGAVILCAVNLMEKAFQSISNYLGGVYSERIKCDLTSLLMRKLSRKEPVMFENPDVLDSVNKAYEGVNVFDWCCYLLINEAAYTAVFVGATLVYLMQKSLLLSLILIASIIPIILVQSKIQKQSNDVENELAPTRRAVEYCEKAVVDRDNFKETRLLGAFSFFYKKYSDHTNELARKKKSLLIRTKLLNVKSNTLSLIGFMVSSQAAWYEMEEENV